MSSFLSFFFRLIFVLACIAVLIIVIPNPLQVQFPIWIKNYENYRDPQSNYIRGTDQLELMLQDPTKCYKTADCILIPCGKVPNCNSITLNTEYIDAHKSDLPRKYQCPSESGLEPIKCDKNTELDAYATCEENQCVIKRIFPSPSPTPEMGIIEKALQK